MLKSARLRSADWFRIQKIVDECREMGADARAWRHHLIMSLSNWIGTTLGFAGEFLTDSSTRVSQIGGVELEWPSGMNIVPFLEAAKTMFSCGAKFNPMWVPYWKSSLLSPGIAFTRSDVLRDAAWYRSDFYQGHSKETGVDHILFAHTTAADDPNHVYLLQLYRSSRDRDFSPRDRAIFSAANLAAKACLQGELAGYHEPSLLALPPRVLQLLQVLLQGDGDKNLARSLNLSPYTVNQYMKVLFNHFSVQSRPKLLARWVQRRWGTTLPSEDVLKVLRAETEMSRFFKSQITGCITR